MIGAVYENLDAEFSFGGLSADQERDAWYLTGKYTMGNIVLKAAYGTADEFDGSVFAGTSNTGADFWTVGADYNLSKRTTVYALYATVDNDSAGAGGALGGTYRLVPYAGATAGSDPSAFSVGIKHTF
jgi:predicted porin